MRRAARQQLHDHITQKAENITPIDMIRCKLVFSLLSSNSARNQCGALHGLSHSRQGHRVRTGDRERPLPTSPNGDAVVAMGTVREAMERTLLPELETMRGHGLVDRAVLTERIRSVCQQAHDHGLRAEQVIILIKELWAQISDGSVRRSGQLHVDGLEEVITRAIDEYYRPAPPSI